jgi:hypothetical protein
MLPFNKAVPYLRRLVAGLPQRLPGFDPRPSHVGFVVAKVALGQVLSEYFGFPCQLSFHQTLHTHLSGDGTRRISGRRTKRTVSPHPTLKKTYHLTKAVSRLRAFAQPQAIFKVQFMERCISVDHTPDRMN